MLNERQQWMLSSAAQAGLTKLNDNPVSNRTLADNEFAPIVTRDLPGGIVFDLKHDLIGASEATSGARVGLLPVVDAKGNEVIAVCVSHPKSKGAPIPIAIVPASEATGIVADAMACALQFTEPDVALELTKSATALALEYDPKLKEKFLRGSKAAIEAVTSDVVRKALEAQQSTVAAGFEHVKAVAEAEAAAKYGKLIVKLSGIATIDRLSDRHAALEEVIPEIKSVAELFAKGVAK